jgi:hypothetical protein
MEEQKDRCFTLCMDLAAQLQEDNSLYCVITGDETWCYQYDPKAKCQCMEWRLKNSSKPKKAQMLKSKVKTTLICFFDIRGTTHFEFVPKGTTVNQTFYVEV